MEEAHQEKRPNQNVINLDLDGDQVGQDRHNSSRPQNEPIRAPWTPAFESFHSGQITYVDSVAEASGATLGILQAAPLPRDAENIPKNAVKIVGGLAQFFILVRM